MLVLMFGGISIPNPIIAVLNYIPTTSVLGPLLFPTPTLLPTQGLVFSMIDILKGVKQTVGVLFNLHFPDVLLFGLGLVEGPFISYPVLDNTICM